MIPVQSPLSYSLPVFPSNPCPQPCHPAGESRNSKWQLRFSYGGIITAPWKETVSCSYWDMNTGLPCSWPQRPPRRHRALPVTAVHTSFLFLPQPRRAVGLASAFSKRQLASYRTSHFPSCQRKGDSDPFTSTRCPSTAAPSSLSGVSASPNKAPPAPGRTSPHLSGRAGQALDPPCLSPALLMTLCKRKAHSPCSALMS